MSDILWQPSQSFKSTSNLQAYLEWLKDRHGLEFDRYSDVLSWSVSELETFWQTIVDFYDIRFHRPPSSILQQPQDAMIGTKWFAGSTLNYTEHIFRARQNDHPAIIFRSERHDASQPPVEISWDMLERQTASLAAFLKKAGVQPGDRVAGFLPNSPHAIIAFLAANSLGASWSSCSPDFGASSVIERFQLIEPKVLFVADGYSYNGKPYDKEAAIKEISAAIPTLETVIFIPYLNTEHTGHYIEEVVLWEATQNEQDAVLEFEAVDFDHPLWILYSSGTTGKPKAITHSNGGNLIEHFKTLGLHQDCKPGDRFFWYSTTGWMMWNYALASMLHGSTVCIYDGAAAYPDINALWDFARDAQIHHFGAGASFYIACMKAGLDFKNDLAPLPSLRSIGSTGSPLPPEAFQWIYDKVKTDVWLISLSGGTDICSGFVGGNPFEPVYKGEIQCRLLACDLHAWNEAGQPVIDEVGEMVITRPMPSMPVFFWGDEGHARYRASYFEMYPGIWRHGDWISINERGGLVIYGRSDATLNRGGVRIGTSEIYNAAEGLDAVRDSLVICIDREDGSHYMPLFIVTAEGVELDEALKQTIKTALRSQYSPRHVPDEIIAVPEIPYTISGKKMETVIKKILSGKDISQAISKDAMKNPGSLEFFFTLQTKD